MGKSFAICTSDDVTDNCSMGTGGLEGTSGERGVENLKNCHEGTTIVYCGSLVLKTVVLSCTGTETGMVLPAKKSMDPGTCKFAREVGSMEANFAHCFKTPAGMEFVLSKETMSVHIVTLNGGLCF